MDTVESRPRRSVLYVPASNERALAKAAALACDTIIFDLEDAVAPKDKAHARNRLGEVLGTFPRTRHEIVVRVNPLDGEWGREDLLAVRDWKPDCILLPKIESPRDVLEANEALEEEESKPRPSLWAMIETPKSLLNVGAIAELGRDRGARLSCLVAGTNDLAKDAGVTLTSDRRYLVPWLMQMVLAARAGGLDVLDGVCNDFHDLGAFSRECEEAAIMGFSGKTLIHPAQIEPANRAFSPSMRALAEARRIVEAFSLAENSGKGVISLDGRMIERLHLAAAEGLLAKAAMLKDGRK